MRAFRVAAGLPRAPTERRRFACAVVNAERHARPGPQSEGESFGIETITCVDYSTAVPFTKYHYRY
jgi:hypothetical protein